MPNMLKPKILFVYAHPKPEQWLDGLSAALDLLEEDFEIERLNLSKEARGGTLNYDFILGWGAFGSGPDLYLQDDWQSDKAKRGLCIAGNATRTDGAENYDVLFYETDWVKNNYLPDHPNKVKAFGINADIFYPHTMPTPIIWDYIGVGAFANWKRWEKMIDRPGSKLVIGEYQEGNEEESLAIARQLIKNGVMVSNQVPPLDLLNYYHWSRKLYMPSDIYGGGERAVLEAKACGLEVEVEGDNPKLKELADLKNVPTHHQYAKALKEGIMSCLK